MTEIGVGTQELGTIRERHDTRPVEIWLAAIALMVALTAVIGAATRLTGSGLSITEWQPILGVIPPLNDVAWQEAFARYKAIPQYAQINDGMSLAGFKSIFWWEWTHRLVARGIGVVFVLPMLIFAALGRLPLPLIFRLLGLLALGALQGGIGWFMVVSGLSERVSVSPYRLALHLGCAVLIFALLIWTILDLSHRRRSITPAPTSEASGAVRWRAKVITRLIYVQVVAGALVAGNKAGLTYNTWPLMDGRLVPIGLGQLRPWWLNLFENVTTVQFDHRMLAYAIAVLVAWQWASMQPAMGPAGSETIRSVRLLLAATLAQIGLGIWTLLQWVPLSLGVMHQAGALTLFAVAIWHQFAAKHAEIART